MQAETPHYVAHLFLEGFSVGFFPFVCLFLQGRVANPIVDFSTSQHQVCFSFILIFPYTPYFSNPVICTSLFVKKKEEEQKGIVLKLFYSNRHLFD